MSVADLPLHLQNSKESKLKFHRNALKTVTSAAKVIRRSPKIQKKNSKNKGRVALMKVSGFWIECIGHRRSCYRDLGDKGPP